MASTSGFRDGRVGVAFLMGWGMGCLGWRIVGGYVEGQQLAFFARCSDWQWGGFRGVLHFCPSHVNPLSLPLPPALLSFSLAHSLSLSLYTSFFSLSLSHSLSLSLSLSLLLLFWLLQFCFFPAD